MANIQERRNKDGKLVSYSIRVFRGRGSDGKQLKPWITTFSVQPGWSDKTARKKAEAYAVVFEKECREGIRSDTKLKFEEYCNYVIGLKEKTGAKRKTIESYRNLTKRIYPALGYLKLSDIRVDHLNSFYTELLDTPVKGTKRAVANCDLRAILKEKKLSAAKLAGEIGLAKSTVENAVKGVSVSAETAEKVSKALGLPFGDTFKVMEQTSTLSAKTVLEYHRLISTVMEQALKESLIPFNPASRATLPKVEKKTPNYFQPEDISLIVDALEDVPLKWQAMTYLYMLSGARRGEILGLRWKDIDFDNNRIHIENCVLYSANVGTYEDSPKNESSERYVPLPVEAFQILKKWRACQAENRFKLGEMYHDNDLVFARDDGNPMHPDSVTKWFAKFAERNNLKHINPHAFRHSMASILFYNKVDPVSISKRLGHSQVSTTTDIYSHIIAEADKQNADLIGDIYLRKHA